MIWLPVINVFVDNNKVLHTYKIKI